MQLRGASAQLGHGVTLKSFNLHQSEVRFDCHNQRKIIELKASILVQLLPVRCVTAQKSVLKSNIAKLELTALKPL